MFIFLAAMYAGIGVKIEGMFRSKHTVDWLLIHALSRCFRLKHYAGEVTYNVTDFVRKNVDSLSRDLSLVMYRCDLSLMKILFPEGVDPNRFNPKILSDDIVRCYLRWICGRRNGKLKHTLQFYS